MQTVYDEHHATNFGLDVAEASHEERLEPDEECLVPAHVDEHARQELLEHHHPDHGTNFGLILPADH